MSVKVLVVEDEALIAFAIEETLLDLGHELVAVASDSRRAREVAGGAELALVDLNLRDGATGIELGRDLARRGLTVLYMSADPGQIGAPVPGTVGVLAKPFGQGELEAALGYALALREGRSIALPPRRLRVFGRQLAAA